MCATTIQHSQKRPAEQRRWTSLDAIPDAWHCFAELHTLLSDHSSLALRCTKSCLPEPKGLLKVITIASTGFTDCANYGHCGLSDTIATYISSSCSLVLSHVKPLARLMFLTILNIW